MSHTVRLEDEVFDRLESARDKSETKSQTVCRLLDLLTSIQELMNTIEGQRAYTEHQKRELGKLSQTSLVSADAVRRDAEARMLKEDDR